MRGLILVVLLSMLCSPLAMAGPGSPASGGYSITTPSEGCDDCVGASSYAHTNEPAGCNDCATVGAAAAAGHEDDALYASAAVCRGGFVYICVVDIDEEVPL